MKKLLLLIGAGVLTALAALIVYGWVFYRSFNPLVVFDPGFYFTPQLELILKAKGQTASVLDTLSLAIVRPPISGSAVFNFNLPDEVTATVQSNGQPTSYSIDLGFSLIPSEGVNPVAPISVGVLAFEPITAPAGEFELVLPITESQQEVSVVLSPGALNQINVFALQQTAAAEVGAAPGVVDSVINAIDTAVTSVNNFFVNPIKQTITDISSAVSGVFQKYDFGDAPDSPAGSFPSRLASNGARHKEFPFYLGKKVGAESDSNQIDEDDLNVGEDDGGALYATGPIGAVVYGVKLAIHNESWPEDQPIYLNILYDQNDNLAWESTGEHIVVDKIFYLKPGEDAIYSVPNINTTGKLNWLRATLTNEKLGASYLGAWPTAFAYGETEDYFLPPPKTPVDFPPFHLISLSKGPTTGGPGPGSAGGSGGPPPAPPSPPPSPPPASGGGGSGPGPGAGGGSGGGTSVPTEPKQHNFILSFFFGAPTTPTEPTKPCDPNDPNAPDNCNPPEITKDDVVGVEPARTTSFWERLKELLGIPTTPPEITKDVINVGEPVSPAPIKPSRPIGITDDNILLSEPGVSVDEATRDVIIGSEGGDVLSVEEPGIFDRLKVFLGIEPYVVPPVNIPVDPAETDLTKLSLKTPIEGPVIITPPQKEPYVVPPVVIPIEPGFFDRIKKFFSLEPYVVPPVDIPVDSPKELTELDLKGSSLGPIKPALPRAPSKLSASPSEPLLPHDTTISRIQNLRENATEVFDSAVQTVQEIRTNVYQDIVLILNPEPTPLNIEQQVAQEKAQESVFSTNNVPADTSLFNAPYPIARKTPEVKVNIIADETIPLFVQRKVEQKIINEQIVADQPVPVVQAVTPVQNIILKLQDDLRALTTEVQNFVAKTKGITPEQVQTITDPITLDKVLVDGKLTDQSIAEIASRPNQCWLSASNDGTKIILNIEVNGTTPTGQVASADAVAEGYDNFNNVVFREIIGGRPISGTAQGNILTSYYSQPTDVARISGRVLSIVPTPTFFGGTGIPSYKRVAVKLIDRNGTNCSDSNLLTRSSSGGASISNPAGGTGQTVLSITPPAACVAGPTITTTTLANGTQGIAYSRSVLATGGQGSVTFSLVSGSLPAGLTLSSAGLLSGTPTGLGLSSFTVRATDSCSTVQTDDQALTLTIDPDGMGFAPARQLAWAWK